MESRMEKFLSTVENVNNAVNGFVWGLPMLVLLVGTGILMTCLTKFFQISAIRLFHFIIIHVFTGVSILLISFKTFPLHS
jgi:Na+/alanine symporter